MSTDETITELPDGTLYPYVEDLDGVWHRRPVDDEWVVSDGGPNATAVCGQRVSSVHVADAGSGSPTCPGCISA